MNLDHYAILTEDYKEYYFYSEGPRGKIKKSVLFVKISDDPVVYNFAFGDVDPITNLVNDLSITNNKDTQKVLVTVARTVCTFCDHFGNHFIYAQGSTAARTRLYQMGISRLRKELHLSFYLYGVLLGVAQPFKPNVNYEAFLVKRK